MATTYTRRINLYINGKEVKNDLVSIRREMNRLTNEQARMTMGSREYNAHAVKIRSLRGVIRQHNMDLNETSKSWFSLRGAAEGFNRYFSMITAAMASFAAVVLGIKSAVNAYAEFDDKIADVMKTTGLTKDQVMALNEELQKMDTRTAQIDRLGLARIGGKLGISEMEDLIGFVKASDQIVVALGEDLGGTEEAIKALGKLTDIFDLKSLYGQEQALLKVGSAINELGMESTANEAYLVNFAKRTAGIAPQAGVGIADILGLAATLDSLGQGAETSSTAYSKLMTTMSKKTSEFAHIAGLNITEFSELLRTDANEAMLVVFEGLQNNTNGFEQLIAALGDLGIEGQRMTQVFGAIAKNVQEVRNKQVLANQAMLEGTSITEEFNIKNNTAQATIDKAIQKFSEIQRELGQRLAPAYASVIKKGSAMVKILGVTTEFLFKHGRTIISLITIITAYTIATKLAVMWQNRQNASTLASIAIQKLQTIAFHLQFAAISLYNVVLGLLSLNLARATIHFRAFTAALMVNPVGLIIGLLATAGTFLYGYYKKAKDAASAQKELNDAMQNMTDMIGKQQYQQFLDEIGTYTENIITLADGSVKVVKSFNDNINVLDKFEKKIKTLRMGELENFKLFFEDEILSIQRNLESLEPGSIQFDVDSAKLTEYTDNLALVNTELADIAEKRKKLQEGTDAPVDFDTQIGRAHV